MSSQMEFNLVADQLGCPVLYVSGRIDAAAALSLREECAAQRAAGNKRLIVSLEKVTFVSSSGLGSFLVISEEFKGAGGSLIYAAPVQSVRHVLKLLNLDQFLDLAPDVDSAQQLLPV
ncbi:STAS domain-containing protein [bacterium]|nr:STAS domain-containing protein [bacterium]